MQLIDCFMYFDEDLVLDIRLNTLDESVNKFVIAESTMDHAGNKKRLAHHKEAHDVGSWVREAAIAYANKKNNVQKSDLWKKIIREYYGRCLLK